MNINEGGDTLAYGDSANILGHIGGIVGLTDPNKANRAVSALEAGQQKANNQLDLDTSQQFNMLQDAMRNRSLSQNLDSFDSAMQKSYGMNDTSAELNWKQQNAGDATNVAGYLNPKMQQMLNNTMQKVQGSAGSSLQSSAATNTASNAVSQMAGQMWDTAFNQAISDAQNNMQVANANSNYALNNANLASAQLNADNAPAEDYLQLANDKAMQRYAGNVALTQAQAEAAGRDVSLLGSLLGGS